MSRQLSIAMLSHMASADSPTGAERSLALLAGELRARGHRVAVVAPGPWVMGETLRARGAEVHTIPCRVCWLAYYEPRPWPVALAKWVRFAWPDRGETAIAEFLSRFEPDVVHVNCLPHLRGAKCAKTAGLPVVWHIREILPPGARRRWYTARLRQHADRIVAVSEAVAAWLHEEGLGDVTEVVHNGVEESASSESRALARRELGLPPDGCVAGLYGQILPHKGALEFVRAGAAAIEDGGDLRFVIAGSGPRSFVDRVRDAMAASERAGRFHLLPPQPTGERLLAASDLVCLTTMTPDPFPRAVLEAMAAARPVVAFRSGGTAEMVEDGVTGRLVENGDVRALATALVELSKDAGLRETMGRAALSRARETFSLDRHVDRMEALLGAVA